MLSFFKKHFNYTKKERQGVNVLLFLIAVGLIFPVIYNKFHPKENWNFDSFENQVDIFLEGKMNEQSLPVAENFALFKFNPNEANFDEFIKLGFTKKQAYTIINYRKAGGMFLYKTDLKKVYGIDQSDFSRVKNYIKLPAKVFQTKIPSEKAKVESKPNEIPELSKNNEKQKLNLNEIDSIALLSINGIGPVFAKRIVNYRNYLGGYYSINQLNEVYGFNQELFAKVSPFLVVDSSQIIHININESHFKEINRHPYFNYTQTKAILKYRNLMNEFKSFNELLESNLIDTNTYNKVKPYLVIK